MIQFKNFRTWAVVALLAIAQLTAVAQQKRKSTATTEDQKPPSPRESIHVHGQWTVAVRNPDGSIAATHRFENSLVPEGAALLVQVLSRQQTVQYWQVRLINKDGCVCSRNNNRVDCGIIDSALTPDVSSDYATLTVTAPTTGPNAGKLVLSGSAPAAFDGQVKAVNTSVGHTCVGNACGTNWNVFTVAFPAPISVQAGQTMDVTVVFSFS